MSILHALIMTSDFSPRIKRATQKDMVSTSSAITLLSDILHLCYTHAKRLNPNKQALSMLSLNNSMLDDLLDIFLRCT